MLFLLLALQASSPSAAAMVAPPQVETSRMLTVLQDTPVELLAPSEVSTADAAPGLIFKLRVNKPVVVDGVVVIPVGTPAFGQVVSAMDSGGLGKSGRMTARLLAIRLGATEIPLEGEMSARGTGAGSAGVAVLFTGLVGLFHRGNNAKIKAGEILAGFVAKDTPVPMPPAAPASVYSPPATAVTQ
jgi:hypothetical protein